MGLLSFNYSNIYISNSSKTKTITMSKNEKYLQIIEFNRNNNAQVARHLILLEANRCACKYVLYKK
jgi:hypothetical protein